MQMVTNVLTATFVAHHHLVATLTAPGDAMQQSRTITRNPTTFSLYILGPVIMQHDLDLLKRISVDISGVAVAHHEPPSLLSSAYLLASSAAGPLVHAGPPVDEGAGIGRVL